VKLIARLHLVPRSRMRGAIHPLHLYAFKTWCSIKKSTGTLPLPLVHYTVDGYTFLRKTLVDKIALGDESLHQLYVLNA
jgi:hypothetical protein